MNKKLKKLGDAELEVMLILWDSSEPVTSSYILENIKDSRKWVLSTLMTTLARLVDKGFVYCDRSTRTNYYSFIISAEDYKMRESRSFLEKLYGNSVQNLIASLYDSKTIDKEDLNEIRKMIDAIEKEEEDV